MTNTHELKARLQELADRDWDLGTIEARFNNLSETGISQKSPQQVDPSQRAELLDRVQRRAEEYCYLMRNCARGTALALFEEFGVGSIETIRALAAFPGIGMTGGTCGAVTGGLLALGLVCSQKDLTNYMDPGPHLAARRFTDQFQEALGALSCAEIQRFIFGKYLDPMASFENLQAFNEAHAREKCPLAPGVGARIASEIILDAMNQNT